VSPAYAGTGAITLFGMRVVKGHGTENDFILLPDLDGELELDADLVRALCDRHAGLGADGVLRVVRTENVPEFAAFAPDAAFFMDYRNADGSLAEMCGNGIRVFVRYLRDLRLVEPSAAVATRGGIKRAQVLGDGDITVQMGQPLVLADRPVVTAALSTPAPGAAIRMPNPHVVVWLADEAELAALDLSRPPAVDPPLPDGQNVEFAVRSGPRRITMRVHERGVGETRSCGTGMCAVAVAAAIESGDGSDGSTWQVDVPGGTCWVQWCPDGEVLLRGPAVIVGELELADRWLAAVRRG
jgi:diaminopimelate epimerase